MAAGEVQVNVQANALQYMCQANGTVLVAGVKGSRLANLTLTSRDGDAVLRLPPEAFPFIQQGDVVLVTLSVVKATGSIPSPIQQVE